MADQGRNLYHRYALRIISSRITWVLLFGITYGTLIWWTWQTVGSILKWYSNFSGDSAIEWPALYASVVFGTIFGALAMAAMLAIAVPAMVITWIAILVMLAFAGKPRDLLVLEGKRITHEIGRFAFKIMLKEGNILAASCAFFSFFLLTRREA